MWINIRGYDYCNNGVCATRPVCAKCETDEVVRCSNKMYGECDESPVDMCIKCANFKAGPRNQRGVPASPFCEACFANSVPEWECVGCKDLTSYHHGLCISCTVGVGVYVCVWVVLCIALGLS
jgi:hypothetical protein